MLQNLTFRDLTCYNTTQYSLYEYLEHAPFKLQYEILYKMDVLKSITSPVLADEEEIAIASSSAAVRKGGERKERGSVVIHHVALVGFTM